MRQKAQLGRVAAAAEAEGIAPGWIADYAEAIHHRVVAATVEATKRAGSARRERVSRVTTTHAPYRRSGGGRRQGEGERARATHAEICRPAARLDPLQPAVSAPCAASATTPPLISSTPLLAAPAKEASPRLLAPIAPVAAGEQTSTTAPPAGHDDEGDAGRGTRGRRGRVRVRWAPAEEGTLVVKPSTINTYPRPRAPLVQRVDAGLGLFTTRAIPGVVNKEPTVVGDYQYLNGRDGPKVEMLTRAAFEARYPEEWMATHVLLNTGTGVYMDAVNGGLMGRINSCVRQQNMRTKDRSSKLLATRRIKANEELYFSYGKDYAFVQAQMHHLGQDREPRSWCWFCGRRELLGARMRAAQAWEAGFTKAERTVQGLRRHVPKVTTARAGRAAQTRAQGRSEEEGMTTQRTARPAADTGTSWVDMARLRREARRLCARRDAAAGSGQRVQEGALTGSRHAARSSGAGGRVRASDGMEALLRTLWERAQHSAPQQQQHLQPAASLTERDDAAVGEEDVAVTRINAHGNTICWYRLRGRVLIE